MDWVVKYMRNGYPSIIGGPDTEAEAKALAARLNEAYQTGNYYAEKWVSDL